MGILGRFTDIMKANINDLLDKCEDPAKMIDQTLRDLNDNLMEVKSETAAVMAGETKAKRDLEECQKEIETLTSYAGKAIAKGNDEDAKKFLGEKALLSAKLADLQTIYETNKANATKMRQMHDKLVADINELDSRKDVIKAKLATAKAQETVNKMTGSVNSNASISAFDKWDAKADKMLDSANAEAELNSTSTNEVKDLKSKYSVGDEAVEDELARMKAEMGL